ncbi:glycosyltransferase family 4 protein [Chachezhania antarctica]|uniref:glycosyltransferase family 4 protein n=1 Tax=Chachezhania antarctica TaxID=2340860 RepID=UPI000EAF097E|nr:glycosyltransferase family 1 protein [Chachezhania antarctica]|tara:strand:- start:10094 stop:11401 length:1308 start_codon:yes stop_codon:yes gene_type:complete
MLPRPIAYDLTEIFTQSSGRDRYYGVARVVSEIGLDLFRCRDDVVFVLFSPGHQSFFELKPFHDPSQPSGIDLNVPFGVKPLKFRNIYPKGRNLLRDILSPLAGAIVRHRNRRTWKLEKISLREISLDGYDFVSAGRPKIVIDMVQAIRKNNWDTKIAVLLHDFFPFHEVDERFGQRFARSFLHDNIFLIERADLILTNSEFTARDLEHFVEAGTLPRPKRIAAIPLAHDCAPSTERPLLLVPEEPYFLCVGSMLGRKNLDVVLDAMVRLHEEGRTVPLLMLAGRRHGHVLKHLQDPRFRNILHRIEHIEHPNQTDLARLYRNALALIIPTRMEGWGLPAGEALAAGCPVVAADAGALRECCGDLALYFDPDDDMELARLMERLHDAPSFRADIVDRIAAAQGSLRSWTDVKNDILQAIRALDGRAPLQGDQPDR